MWEAARRVLFVSSGYPWPLDNGAVIRTFHLVSALAAHHRVTMVALRRNGASGAAQSPLHALCERFIVVDNGEVIDRAGGPYGLWRPLGQRLTDVVAPGLPAGIRRWWSNPLLETLIRLRKTDDYDMVWAERPAQAEVARMAGWRNVVVDLVDRDSEAVGRTLRPDGIVVMTVDLFLNLAPFASIETGDYGRNINVRRFLELADLELVFGDPAELLGFDAFRPDAVVKNARSYLVSRAQSVAQCVVARPRSR